MHILKPFYSQDLDTGVQLSAKAKLESDLWTFSFALKDSKNAVLLPPKTTGGRNDFLWKTTCFEVFAKNPGSTEYYEFNFSPSGEWNIYEFKDYRSPQPPTASSDFKLQSLDFANGILTAKVQPLNKTAAGFLFNFTAVIETTDLQYWAVNHSMEKPDFHDFKTFIIKKEAL